MESGLKSAKSPGLSHDRRCACCERYVQYTESIGERDSANGLCLMKAPSLYLSRNDRIAQIRSSKNGEEFLFRESAHAELLRLGEFRSSVGPDDQGGG